jgi:hypothetical protein
MFTSKDDLVQVAALAKLLVKDNLLKSKVINMQRKRRNSFSTAVNECLSHLISKIEEEHK